MKLTLPDGQVIERRWSPGMCTGYVAKAVEINADDIRSMRLCAAADPKGFYVAMLQFEHRFPERRMG